MTTNHTPGPWRYEAGRDGRPPYVIRRTEGGFVVVGMTADRQEADARLIAAAPELLEALQKLLDLQVAKKELEYLDKGIGTKTPNAAWLEARAAVAKARGEQ
ncbi:hypothetical protein ACOTJB_23805 [Achromobacter xylosoxidans]